MPRHLRKPYNTHIMFKSINCVMELRSFKICTGISSSCLYLQHSEIKLILVKEMPVRTLDPFMVIGEQRIHLFHPASHALEHG